MSFAGVLIAFGLAAWIVSVGASAHFAAEKGRSVALGAALGFLFGVFGLAAVLLMPDARPRRAARTPGRARLVYEAWPEDDGDAKAKPRASDPAEDEAFGFLADLSPPVVLPSRRNGPGRTSS